MTTQPYPNLPAWQDMGDLLGGGWSDASNTRYFRVMVEPNTVHLSVSLECGGSRTDMIRLPAGMRPAEVQTFPAFFRDNGHVEVQISASSGHVFIMNHSWPGSAAATGDILMFTHSFQRSLS